MTGRYSCKFFGHQLWWISLALILFAVLLSAAGCGGGDRAPESVEEAISIADVEAVRLVLQEDGWEVSVTVRHEESGWEHYADWWRITDQSGRELARRVLRHPHLDEQPFTRSLRGVEFPSELRQVVVEAHCSVHGTGGQTVTVDLSMDQGPGFTVQR